MRTFSILRLLAERPRVPRLDSAEGGVEEIGRHMEHDGHKRKESKRFSDGFIDDDVVPPGHDTRPRRGLIEVVIKSEEGYCLVERRAGLNP